MDSWTSQPDIHLVGGGGCGGGRGRGCGVLGVVAVVVVVTARAVPRLGHVLRGLGLGGEAVQVVDGGRVGGHRLVAGGQAEAVRALEVVTRHGVLAGVLRHRARAARVCY